ncbi:hypothetical protein ABT115_23980 [Streptomyces sp. NPDC001832]|uniref:kynureninase/PvdN C-terminal domain-containing protein n=1 Tax=Streptomyces sp. NPDC001832 TaxID=3154527 RepID=UPI00331EDD30
MSTPSSIAPKAVTVGAALHNDAAAPRWWISLSGWGWTALSFSAPDVLRFGFTPLYLGFTEVKRAARVLATILG